MNDLAALLQRANHEVAEDRRLAALMREPRNREVLLSRAQVTDDLARAVQAVEQLCAEHEHDDWEDVPVWKLRAVLAGGTQ